MTLKEAQVGSALRRLDAVGEIKTIRGVTKFKLLSAKRIANASKNSILFKTEMIIGSLDKDKAISAEELCDKIKDRYGVCVKRKNIMTALAPLSFSKRIVKNRGASQIRLAPTEQGL